MNYSRLLDKIMNCDPYVRFVVILDKNGNKKESRIKEGTENFLPPEEMDMSLNHALNAWKFRSNFSKFVGKSKFVLAVYEKVRRVTVPIGDEYLMLVAFDNKGGQKAIVDRILAIIEGDYTKPITPGFQY